jgi:hypothetical protein
MSADHGWRRRTLPAPHPQRPGQLAQVANSAVSAHSPSQYCVFVLRSDHGGARIVAHLSGRGRGYGPWYDTLIDLETGEEFEISSDDETLAARRLSLKELPTALRDAWPRNKSGRPIPPFVRDGSSNVTPDQLRALAQLGLDLQSAKAMPIDVADSPSPR